jgi:hypothetical protein
LVKSLVPVAVTTQKNHMLRPPPPLEADASMVRPSQSEMVAAKVKAGEGRRGLLGCETKTTCEAAAGQRAHLAAVLVQKGFTWKGFKRGGGVLSLSL